MSFESALLVALHRSHDTLRCVRVRLHTKWRMRSNSRVLARTFEEHLYRDVHHLANDSVALVSERDLREELVDERARLGELAVLEWQGSKLLFETKQHVLELDQLFDVDIRRYGGWHREQIDASLRLRDARAEISASNVERRRVGTNALLVDHRRVSLAAMTEIEVIERTDQVVRLIKDHNRARQIHIQRSTRHWIDEIVVR